MSSWRDTESRAPGVGLGAELRKLRERAGLTAREAGELLNVNAARISSIEGGRFGVRPDA
ncbi:helix-turn-helix domain-containing protein [Streptomyces acidicola]|uniref:helix-turn-helix domain-containing protein n=1 Tax=Streptomyces acidicola TaxID=2596892 RepID=UPI003829E1B7